MPRPSLNALRAFEATARLRSFGEAAEELSVTHGAISRHIRSLEDNLGVLLLLRNAHATEPTPEGAQLAQGLSRAFNLIQASLDQVRPGPLTLSCSASIMMYWLLPRLSTLHRKEPQLEIGFHTGHGEVDFARENISVAIRLTTIKPPRDVEPEPLVDEWIGVVCSPEYMSATRITTVDDLERARLLATATRPAAWDDWFEASGHMPARRPAIAESFEHFYLLIQAAKCGLGVATVPRMLVRGELDSGTLVAPFGFVKGPRQLVLWVAPHLQARPQTVALVQWLKEEMLRAEGKGA
ncbi:LysR substrate-binding domain-containing protein [Paraburkholderia susongensis]|uniref:DNA-binding transcriptional regulator, LysR family n=1 Tax=Paraburkholderia susongensis TaxID=1515439 RepID=A0A1X7L7J7_9BURK|nr:LysR substrate-binding domain-containing protein [Paraburkholderia susongensis]SMG49821.1 DNA-binding transcriptional regulator, LysR family [Paraburkholderia susongensis]